MTQDELLNKILAKLVNVEAYMHENLATKQELQEAKSEIMTHVDGFIKLHQTLVPHYVLRMNALKND